jgi:hypothetical protein
MLPGVDLFTQLVATRMRSALGAAEKELPQGDSVLKWNQLSGTVSLTTYRDGRFAWSRDTTPKPAWAFYQPSTELLERALAETRDDGELIFVPDELVFDSVAFTMSYTWPRPSSDGVVPGMIARLAIPVFSLSVPWEKPPVTVREPRVRYPEVPRLGYAEGRVLLQFIVDTAGRADLKSVRELGHPELSGALAQYYQEFLAAAIESLEHARFAPAQIGGCRVPALVQLPFQYKLKR